MKLSYEVRFGVVTVIAILALIFGVSYMQGKRIFGSTLTLYAKYQNIQGLIKGNPVYINGVTVGQIMSTQYQDSVVSVEIKLDEDWFIPADSYAEIYAKDLIGVGGQALQIIKGNSNLALEDEDYIEGRIKKGMFDEIGENAEAKLGDIPNDLQSIISGLKSSIERMDTLLAATVSERQTSNILNSVESSMANLDKVSAELAKTMPELSKMTKELSGNTENINSTLTNVKTLSDSLAASSADLRSAAISAKSALEGVDKIVTEINGTNGTLGKLINQDSLYNDLNGTVQSVKALIDAVRKNPQKYMDVDVYLIERKKKE